MLVIFQTEPKVTPSLEPIEESDNLKARKKLCREDAVQVKTLSLETAFGDNHLQHTGEFHDCIPLPVFDARALDLKLNEKEPVEGIFLLAAPGRVVLIPGEPDPRYLNFITSVEDDFPEPKGVVIEDITSLTDEDQSRPSTAVEQLKAVARKDESLSDVSMNIEEVLGLGDEPPKKTTPDNAPAPKVDNDKSEA